MSTDDTVPPFDVEPATLDDLAPTTALWAEAGLTRPWNDPAADFRQAIRTPTSEIFIIRRNTEIVASVMVGYEGHRGWVYYLATADAYRGQGLGQRLMQKCETWLLAQNCPKLMLMVRSSNSTVIDYYKALGYSQSDVVTMEKWLRPKVTN